MLYSKTGLFAFCSLLFAVSANLFCSASVFAEGEFDKEEFDTADQPNILMVFLDDLGWKDTGYMG